MEGRDEWREQFCDPAAVNNVPVITGVVDPTPSVKERPREGTAGVAAEAAAHRGASGAGDRKRTAGGAGPAEMHAARKGPASQGSKVPGAGACGAASSEREKAVRSSSEGAALSAI